VTENVQSATVNLQGVSEIAVATVSITAKIRVNLAVQHMLAAARFSREVGQLEEQHRGEQFGEFWESILHHATACVLTAVASLEAYANELFTDRSSLFPAYSPELMNNLWETYEQKPILQKFEFALLLLRKPVMDSGAGLSGHQGPHRPAKCIDALQARVAERGNRTRQSVCKVKA
jgi:hypothetical protein